MGEDHPAKPPPHHAAYQEEYEEEAEDDGITIDHPSSSGGGPPKPSIFVPNRIEMSLLCLDYLRNQLLLPSTGSTAANNTAAAAVPLPSPQQRQYLSIAVWALQQSLTLPTVMVTSTNNNNDENTPPDSMLLFPDGTDAWMTTGTPPFVPTSTTSNTTDTTATDIPWPPPSLETIYSQIQSLPSRTTTTTNHSGPNPVSSSVEEKKMDDSGMAPADHDDGDDPEENHYDDEHSSNLYRCYNHHQQPTEPHQLHHLVTMALHALSSSSSRVYHETQLLLGRQSGHGNHNNNNNTTSSSALFATYLQAVVQKGYFSDCLQPSPPSTTTHGDDDVAYMVTDPVRYQDKFRKVVTKFRTKCAASTVAPREDDRSLDSNYYQSLVRSLREPSVAAPLEDSTHHHTSTTTTIHGIPIPPLYVPLAPHQQRMILPLQLESSPTAILPPNHHHHHQYGSSIPPSESMTSYYSVIPPSSSTIMPTNYQTTPSHQQHQQPNHNNTSLTQQSQQNHPSDIQEAEKYKNLGNTYMQQKLYAKAIECYTSALQYAPLSYNAHVYYSNRAAAYISTKDYPHAILDSERALMLVPTYGKGHARLGLAYFLSAQYRSAVEAYTVALKYDPDNQSSKNYLEKSALRLAEQEQLQQGAAAAADSTNDPHSANHVTAASSPHVSASNNSFSVISEMERNSNHYQNHHPVAQHNTSNNNNRGSVPHYQSPPTIATAPSTSSSVLQDHRNIDSTSVTTSSKNDTVSGGNDTVIKEAERCKVKGNTYMSQKEYHNAIQSYTKAIQLLPNDVQKSHVYYSNRAAAFCYLEFYHDAEMDASRAIQLVPTYGKAYARLGLSRFLLKNYAGAIAAYETALQYDPSNSASQSYLQKAQQKLALQQQQQQQQNVPTTASVSSSGGTRTGLV